MRMYLILVLGLLMSMSVLGGIFFGEVEMPIPENYDIEAEMEKRFAIRDNFKEKGNCGKYLKFSHLQP